MEDLDFNPFPPARCLVRIGPTMTTYQQILDLFPASSSTRSMLAAAEAGWTITIAASPVSPRVEQATVEQAMLAAAEDPGLLTFSQPGGFTPPTEPAQPMLPAATAHGRPRSVGAAVQGRLQPGGRHRSRR